MLSSLRDYIEPEAESDESLDLLVKHALKSHTPHTPVPSTSNVWSKLSRRVRGPFGKMAVEGPAASGDELAVLGPNGSPFSLGDDKRSMLPFGNSQETSEQHTAMFHATKEAIQMT
jgi:hypothetical protein